MSGQTHNREREWLAGLVAGDPVLVSRHGWGAVEDLAKVERVTATLVIVAGDRYQKRTGRGVGDSTWSGRYLVEPTPERVAVAAEARTRSRAVNALRNVSWSNLPTAALTRIVAILNEPDADTP